MRLDDNIAPECYYALRTKNERPIYSIEKDMVFALGLYMLKDSLIENELNIYDSNSYSINETELDNCFELIKRIYN